VKAASADSASSKPIAPRPLDLDAIRNRLLRAGYPRPTPNAVPQPRPFSPDAQRAREELREHIVADVWALTDAVEAARAAKATPSPARRGARR
jgi:hypothetical protein